MAAPLLLLLSVSPNLLLGGILELLAGAVPDCWAARGDTFSVLRSDLARIEYLEMYTGFILLCLTYLSEILKLINFSFVVVS